MFTDPTSPTAATRAKQAAVLYDELIFKVGLYEVTTTANGSTGEWTPPDRVTTERLKEARDLPESGSSISMAVGVNPEQMIEVFGGEITAHYMSEFHTGILEDLKQFKPDWVKTVLVPNTIPSNEPLGKTIRSLDRYDSRDKDFCRSSSNQTRSAESLFTDRSTVTQFWQLLWEQYST